jgi:transcriptional regulator with XRE-family HTH domain
VVNGILLTPHRGYRPGMGDHRSTEVGGVRLAYRVSGSPDAPPLVLLHGTGATADDWDGVSAALAEHWRVYALDLRGHGRSDWPGSSSEGAIDLSVCCILASQSMITALYAVITDCVGVFRTLPDTVKQYLKLPLDACFTASVTVKDGGQRHRNRVEATGRHVAANLKRLRVVRGMSTTDLARELEAKGRPIAATGITRIEAGQRAVDVDDLLTLALVLRVPPSALLFPLTDDPDDSVEITALGKLSARKTWSWADGSEPIKDPFDEDDYADLQLHGRPKFKRSYIRRGERTLEERQQKRAEKEHLTCGPAPRWC